MICGERANRRLHHPIGRDEKARQIDPDLVMELCHDHHMLCHDDWYTFELVEVTSRLTLIEVVELALRRLAPALARIDAGQGGDTFWGRLAATCVMLAISLRVTIEVLDSQYPEWRSNPMLYRPTGRLPM